VHAREDCSFSSRSTSVRSAVRELSLVTCLVTCSVKCVARSSVAQSAQRGPQGVSTGTWLESGLTRETALWWPRGWRTETTHESLASFSRRPRRPARTARTFCLKRAGAARICPSSMCFRSCFPKWSVLQEQEVSFVCAHITCCRRPHGICTRRLACSLVTCCHHVPILYPLSILHLFSVLTGVIDFHVGSK